jgi:CRP-like cAMP-binding protein
MANGEEFLKSVRYFAGLGNDKLDSVRKAVFEKKFFKGDVIIIEGEPADTLYFVGSGAVKTFRTSIDGKEQALSIVRPGESFNDVAIFDNGPNLASAQAMGPATVYGISKQDLLAFLKEHPEAALNVANILAARLRYFVSLIDDLSFKPVVSRVARILLEYGGNGQESGQRITQQDMAAIVGTVREVIGRSLKTLERNHVIRMERHRIIITDREALENMAGVSNETRVTDSPASKL